MSDRSVMACGLLILATLVALLLVPRLASIVGRVEEDASENGPASATGVSGPVDSVDGGARASADADTPIRGGAPPERQELPTTDRPSATVARLDGPATWGRDPFVHQRDVTTAPTGVVDTPPGPLGAAMQVDEPTVRTLRLVAILSDSDGNRTAVVNRRIVRLGDTIDGWTVRELRDDALVLERDGRTNVLRLAGSRAPASGDRRR